LEDPHIDNNKEKKKEKCGKMVEIKWKEAREKVRGTLCR